MAICYTTEGLSSKPLSLIKVKVKTQKIFAVLVSQFINNYVKSNKKLEIYIFTMLRGKHCV